MNILSNYGQRPKTDEKVEHCGGVCRLLRGCHMPGTTKQMAKPLPESLENRPPEMKKLFQLLNSREEWSTNGVMAKVDAGVFGPTPMVITVEYTDLELLMTNGRLHQNILAWFLADLCIAMSRNPKNRCAFVSPVNAIEIERDSLGVTNSIFETLMMHKKDKEFLLVPYLQENHWSLLIVFPGLRMVNVFDSKMSSKKPSGYKIKDVLDTAITNFNDVIRPHMPKLTCSVFWKMCPCNQQQYGWESGYYVVYQILDFVMIQQKFTPFKEPWIPTHSLPIYRVENVACLIAITFTMQRMKKRRMR